MKKSDNVFLSGPSQSVIVRAVERFCRWIYVLLASGLFGHAMNAYRNEEALYEDSTVLSVTRGIRGDRQNRDRRKLAQTIEGSRIIGLFRNIGNDMLGVNLSVYGIFFLLFGSYSIASYYIQDVLRRAPDLSALIAGIALFVISIPMLMINQPLFRVIADSRIASWFFESFLGLNIRVRKEYTARKVYLIVLLASVLCGGLTFLFSPAVIIGAIFLFIAMCVVLAQPEAGVILAIFAAPLIASSPVATPVLMTILWLSAIGLTAKLFQGRRVLHIEVLDVAVCLFGVLYLLGGVVTAGGFASFKSAMVAVSVILAYFLIVNLMRTSELLERCRISLLLSGALVVLYGIVSFAYEQINAAWAEPNALPEMTRRMTSTFDSPNVLAFYLVFILALLMPELFKKERSSRRVMYAVQVFLTVICILLTWSRVAWLGAIVVIFGYLLIYSHKTLRVILMGILPAGCVLTLGLDWVGGALGGRGILLTMVDRFTSIGSAADSTARYRLNLWRGVGRMLRQYWFSGIGVGSAAFAEVYPLYAEVGLESAVHTHNLYLQILSDTGVAGLLVFACIVILFAQCCFGHMRTIRETDPECRCVLIAGVVLVAALLAMGVADYVFYNSCVTFTFWCVVGYVVGTRRCSMLERESILASSNGTAQQADWAWTVIE